LVTWRRRPAVALAGTAGPSAEPAATATATEGKGPAPAD
jgi:hypothetical protein